MPNISNNHEKFKLSHKVLQGADYGCIFQKLFLLSFTHNSHLTGINNVKNIKINQNLYFNKNFRKIILVF